MSTTRPRLLTAFVLATLVVVATAAAQEKYPSRPIDVIVTWGTGGGADSMARQIAAT
ncbi:MAG: hypothetical protein HYR51_04645 [Candidatus Rokubacteria bacterium]|nr:hypothetical protein [Candidatus Rokubacteria bacterium]